MSQLHAHGSCGGAEGDLSGVRECVFGELKAARDHQPEREGGVMGIVERPRMTTWLARDWWEGAKRERKEEYLQEINSLPEVRRVGTKHSADDIIIRGMRLMNDMPMNEAGNFIRKFDGGAVKQTVPMVRSKPVLINHTTSGWDGLPVGRFFRADHALEGSVNWLDALFFMLNDQQGQRLANMIDGGILSENSPTIEFDRVYCSVCGKDDLNCEHVTGKLYEGHKCYAVMTDIVDFWEGSLVWAGMQKNTSQFIPAGRSVAELSLEDYLTGKRRAAQETAERRQAESYWWK
jgi:hypothetical protein